MLLTGLQGKYECTVALCVHGLAYDAAGQLAHMLGGGCHVAKVGAAEAQGHAKGLAFAYGYISAAFCGGLDYCKGYGVAAHYVHCACLMHKLSHSLGLFKLAVEIGLLYIEGGYLFGEHFLQGIHVGLAVLCGDDAQLVIGAVAVGAYGVYGIGMGSGGNEGNAALSVPAHGGGFRGGSCPVVYGGVGYVHAGKGAYHGLIFKYGLKHALAHFSLIGSISGKEFFFGGNVLYDAGDIVIIGACAPEHRGEYTVLSGHLLHCAADLQLAHALGQVKGPVKVHFLRHVLIKVAIILKAYGTKHFPALFPCRRHIASH